MKTKIKELKIQSKKNIEEAVLHIMNYRLNKWFVPRHMQMYLNKIKVDIDEKHTYELLVHVYTESRQDPWVTIEFDSGNNRFRCTNYFMNQ